VHRWQDLDACSKTLGKPLSASPFPERKEAPPLTTSSPGEEEELFLTILPPEKKSLPPGEFTDLKTVVEPDTPS
jgi:hypothetical protein